MGHQTVTKKECKLSIILVNRETCTHYYLKTALVLSILFLLFFLCDIISVFVWIDPRFSPSLSAEMLLLNSQSSAAGLVYSNVRVPVDHRSSSSEIRTTPPQYILKQNNMVSLLFKWMPFTLFILLQRAVGLVPLDYYYSVSFQIQPLALPKTVMLANDAKLWRRADGEYS